MYILRLKWQILLVNTNTKAVVCWRKEDGHSIGREPNVSMITRAPGRTQLPGVLEIEQGI